MKVNSWIPRSLVMLTVTLLWTLSGVASARPLLVFSGGFGSCPLMGSTSEIKSRGEMDKLAASIKNQTGQDPIQVRTCYAFGSESTIYVTASELSIVDGAMTRDEFYQVVRSAAEVAGPQAPVYVWGQSHGGWTAMNVVANVKNLNYRMLTSVDPISVAECGPVVFSGGVLTGSADGCRRAPKDLESLYPMIASRVKQWINWYQLEFSLLHSAPIPAAHQNIQRQFDAPWWTPMGSHSMTERDPMMWEKTTEMTTLDIAGSFSQKLVSDEARSENR
jgi:hypothetical protein